jgi:hypothetical protein
MVYWHILIFLESKSSTFSWKNLALGIYQSRSRRRQMAGGIYFYSKKVYWYGDYCLAAGSDKGQCRIPEVVESGYHPWAYRRARWAVLPEVVVRGWWHTCSLPEAESEARAHILWSAFLPVMGIPAADRWRQSLWARPSVSSSKHCSLRELTTDTLLFLFQLGSMLS